MNNHTDRGNSVHKLCWIDIRKAGESKSSIVTEAIHQRMDAIVADELADLEPLPPTISRVLFPHHRPLPDELSGVDIVIVDPDTHGEPALLAARHPGIRFGRYVEIVDAPTLDLACDAALHDPFCLLHFRDPTKIPLEIVIASAAAATGSMITMVADVTEAEIVFGVLEHGSDGVMLAPDSVGTTTRLARAASVKAPHLELVELEVTRTEHVGMGERACVDTCTHFGQDEGMLVGSHSKGMVLCVSETHPLPYMPTRPFRVNAGAIHSYTLSANGRTNYLSELGAGAKVLAVNIKGETRVVTVGRVKIESRPLLSIDAVGPDGTVVNLIVQDDWHVRVLGPGGVVLNSTEIKPGDRLLGYLPSEDRHVGHPINEFCLEK